MFINYRDSFLFLLLSFLFFYEIYATEINDANDACSDLDLITKTCTSQMKTSGQKSVFLASSKQSDRQKEELLFPKIPSSCQVILGKTENLCAGFTCIVNNVHECRRVMRMRACGLAVFTQIKNQTNQFHCKMLLPRNSSFSFASPIYLKESVTNILYFKMYSGVGASPTAADAFLSSKFSSEILFPRTTTTIFSTGNYYKSPLWNIRDELGASTVTVAMHGNMDNDGSDSCELTFANTTAANGGWFNKDNLISSFPPNVYQLKSLRYDYFSIKGRQAAEHYRQFYTMQNIRGKHCPGDIGSMVIVNKVDDCSWGNSPQPVPRFKCAAAWNPDSPLTKNEPNINSRGRFMKEFEITGRLLKPINILYV